MAIPDPTEEIKSIRHRLGADLGFDLDRIVAEIQQRQLASGRTYISLPPRRIADHKSPHTDSPSVLLANEESTSTAG